MSDHTTIFAVGCLLVLGLASSVFISRRRHRRDLTEYLVPDLRKCGVDFISAVYPGSFKVGPFPKFEVEIGRLQTRVGGVRGEYNEYRIVSFRDTDGRVYHLWALVEFEAFQFRRVRWRAEQANSLPQKVLNILEG
jgi:hypothetical protein